MRLDGRVVIEHNDALTERSKRARSDAYIIVPRLFPVCHPTEGQICDQVRCLKRYAFALRGKHKVADACSEGYWSAMLFHLAVETQYVFRIDVVLVVNNIHSHHGSMTPVHDIAERQRVGSSWRAWKGPLIARPAASGQIDALMLRACKERTHVNGRCHRVQARTLVSDETDKSLNQPTSLGFRHNIERPRTREELLGVKVVNSCFGQRLAPSRFKHTPFRGESNEAGYGTVGFLCPALIQVRFEHTNYLRLIARVSQAGYRQCRTLRTTPVPASCGVGYLAERGGLGRRRTVAATKARA